VSRLPVRLRLTLAFTAVMAVVLAAVGLFVYSRVGSDLGEALDQSLRTRADELAAVAGSSRLGSGPGDRLVEPDEGFSQVLGTDGRVVDATPGFEGAPLLDRRELARARAGAVFADRESVSGFDENVRLLARPADGYVVVAGASREERSETLASLGTVLLIGGPIALLLSAIAGYGLASAALRPVAAMRREAAEISRLSSGRRLPVPPAGDELAELGDTLNEMLDRLERAAERERGFVASASHELRTPLALLRAELELALREGRTPDELCAAVASAASESDRLVQLAEDLLVLARADEGRLPVRPERLDAAELLETTARRFEARAVDAGRELRVSADGLVIEADRLRAEQALANLVDNALRHGAGAVELTAEPVADGVRLHVLDRGPGFDPSLNGRAFERFTRVAAPASASRSSTQSPARTAAAPAAATGRTAARTPGSSCRAPASAGPQPATSACRWARR
jgi:signal transduction histidine kinase